MRKEAKEFRFKKPSNHMDKIQSMNLPKLPLPDEPLNYNSSLPPSKEQSKSNFRGPPNGMMMFDKDKFIEDFVEGSKKLPPELLNFFMNNDIDQLSAQFMAALQEGKLHTQPRHGKSKIVNHKQAQLEKQMSQPNVEAFNESTLQIEGKPEKLEVEKRSQKPRSIQGSRNNSKNSSRNSSNEDYKNGNLTKSDKKGKQNRHCRHFSSQFKQESRHNLKKLEAETLYVNHNYPLRKSNSINSKKK